MLGLGLSPVAAGEDAVATFQKLDEPASEVPTEVRKKFSKSVIMLDTIVTIVTIVSCLLSMQAVAQHLCAQAYLQRRSLVFGGICMWT